MKQTRGSQDGRRLVFGTLPTIRGRRSFAQSWWGQAWIRALEGPSPAATGRLARGRTYARGGNVGPISITPGRADTAVQGSEPAPYRTSMAVRPLSPAQWDGLLDAVAAKAGHLAALLDHDMPADLVEDASKAGVQLLPSLADLTPQCSCPDWGNPCKHAAALYYQVARLLDTDPFVLLLLRGRGAQEVTADLHRRNTALVPAAPASAPRPGGVAARTVFAAAREGLPPLPEPPLLTAVGPVADLAGNEEPSPGLDPAALQFLAETAAARAADLLEQSLQPHDPDRPPVDFTLPGPDEDLVRLAAADPPAHILTRLAWTGHRTPSSLARAARAWRYGGRAALPVLDDSWEPEPAYLRAVREEVRHAFDGQVGLRIAGNWLTVIGSDAQLRLGTEGLWYPYVRKHGGWWPAGHPHRDVTAVLGALVDP
ncbi:SWIM zinc finger family protein [Streptacidiphilus sp. EB103A]|uniref:SWIM zinc finger family protein n=1 Tax=Streptacidiphilus sp. EB103A TaxID=3156275 RepID=UPI00351247F4